MYKCELCEEVPVNAEGDFCKDCEALQICEECGASRDIRTTFFSDDNDPVCEDCKKINFPEMKYVLKKYEEYNHITEEDLTALREFLAAKSK